MARQILLGLPLLLVKNHPAEIFIENIANICRKEYYLLLVHYWFEAQYIYVMAVILVKHALVESFYNNFIKYAMEFVLQLL